MTPTIDVNDPASLAVEYLDLMKTAEELESQAKQVKDNLVRVLPYTEGFKAGYGPAFVQWVKGRRSEKVDVKVLRRELVLAGVDLALLELVFAAATTVTEGQPSMRVSAAEKETE